MVRLLSNHFCSCVSYYLSYSYNQAGVRCFKPLWVLRMGLFRPEISLQLFMNVHGAKEDES